MHHLEENQRQLDKKKGQPFKETWLGGYDSIKKNLNSFRDNVESLKELSHFSHIPIFQKYGAIMTALC